MLFFQVVRWPDNGYVKKLVRRDGYFYYYNRARECPDKEVHKTKIYFYQSYYCLVMVCLLPNQSKSLCYRIYLLINKEAIIIDTVSDCLQLTLHKEKLLSSIHFGIVSIVGCYDFPLYLQSSREAVGHQSMREHFLFV